MRDNKSFRISMIVGAVMCLLPMLAGVLLYDSLPDRIAVHFDIHNNPNNYYSKNVAITVIPLGMLALHLLVCRAAKFTKKENEKLQWIFIYIIPVVTVVVMGIMYGYALDNTVNVGSIVITLVGILFVIIGNFMPKIRPNHVMGIRIPSTYKSEENWYRTHRMGGFVWVACGIIMVAAGFFKAYYAAAACILAAVIIPVIYSVSYKEK
ncbi:MAG: SdpI family protein [Anaerovoracaceae bacterium]